MRESSTTDKVPLALLIMGSINNKFQGLYDWPLSDDIIEALRLDGRWPTEEMIQQACLDDCTVKYSNYDEWWDNHSSGVSRLIRKLCLEEIVGESLTWEVYHKWDGTWDEYDY